MKPPRTLSVSAALHSRLWLLKIRRKARTLDDIVESANDAAMDYLNEYRLNVGRAHTRWEHAHDKDSDYSDSTG